MDGVILLSQVAWAWKATRSRSWRRLVPLELLMLVLATTLAAVSLFASAVETGSGDPGGRVDVRSAERGRSRAARGGERLFSVPGEARGEGCGVCTALLQHGLVVHVGVQYFRL